MEHTRLYYELTSDILNYNSLKLLKQNSISDIWLFDCIEGSQRKNMIQIILKRNFFTF